MHPDPYSKYPAFLSSVGMIRPFKLQKGLVATLENLRLSPKDRLTKRVFGVGGSITGLRSPSWHVALQKVQSFVALNVPCLDLKWRFGWNPQVNCNF